MIASSAILGTDPVTGVMPDDADTQAKNAFINMKRLLAEYGLDEHDVLKPVSLKFKRSLGGQSVTYVTGSP
jgi:enamine deaminase RidA (YjgF/YER057c/UK114 family)